jgi:hypothetical protein
MMSEPQKPEPISDEVLSAFLDGELPHDQEARVKRWLATSPAARRKLEDFRHLSRLVQELPRGELPTEFAAQVLQQAERRMLLPAVSASERHSSRRNIRWWALTVAAPLTATAALLFISIRLGGPNPQNAGVKTGRGTGTSITPDTMPQGQQSNAASASIETSQPTLLADASLLPAAPVRLEAESTPEAAAVPAAKASAEIAADKEKADPAAAGSKTSTQLAALVDEIRTANEQGQIPVVRMYVVDSKQGMELVQVVLDEHRIPRDPRLLSLSKKTDVESATKPLPGPAATAKALVGEPSETTSREALFVVGDVAELQGALQSLVARNHGTLDWKLEKPIDLDRFDSPSKGLVEGALVALQAAGTAHLSADSPASKTPPAMPGKPSLGLAAVKSDGGPRQMLVRFADPRLTASATTSPVKAVDPVVAANESRLTASKEAAGSKEAKGSRRSRAHVILIVEPRAPAAPPAKGAAAEPGSGDGAA